MTQPHVTPAHRRRGPGQNGRNAGDFNFRVESFIPQIPSARNGQRCARCKLVRHAPLKNSVSRAKGENQNLIPVTIPISTNKNRWSRLKKYCNPVTVEIHLRENNVVTPTSTKVMPNQRDPEKRHIGLWVSPDELRQIERVRRNLGLSKTDLFLRLVSQQDSLTRFCRPHTKRR